MPLARRPSSSSSASASASPSMPAPTLLSLLLSIASVISLATHLAPAPSSAHYREFVQEHRRLAQLAGVSGRDLHGDWVDVVSGVTSLAELDPVTGAAPEQPVQGSLRASKTASVASAASNVLTAEDPYSATTNGTSAPTPAPTLDPDYWPDITDADLQRAWDAQLNKPGRAASYTPITIPVAFHLIYKTDGTGLVSINAVQKQVEELTKSFTAVEAKAAGWPTVSTAITFTLYSVDYTLNDDWYDNCALFNYQPTVKKALAVNPAKYYNVYSCNCAGNLGLSFIPYQAVAIYGSGSSPQVLNEDSYMLGSIVDSGLLPGSTYFGGRWSAGKILVHESGHHLGLMHIYQGGCVGTEQQSDQILDTMRQNGNPSGTCGQLNAQGRSCAGIPCPECVETKYDDNANYMGIAADSCRTHFTKGQVDYIRNTIQQYKPTLLQNLPVDCVAAVDGTDASPDLAPCRGPVQPAGTQGRARAWCVTSPFGDNTQWGWACCASDGSSCRDMTQFSRIVSSGRGGPPTNPTSPVAAAPPSAPPPTRPPSNAPTKHTKAPKPTKATQTKPPSSYPTKCTYVLSGTTTPCAIPFTATSTAGTQVTYQQPIPVFVSPPYNWASRKGVSMSTVWCPSVSSYSARSDSSKAKWGPAVCA